MSRIAIKAHELSSEYVRTHGLVVSQIALENLVERAMVEGAKIGAETGMFLTKEKPKGSCGR